LTGPLEQPTTSLERRLKSIKIRGRDYLKIHKAQLLSYMKLLDIPLGLIINFNVLKLTDGVSRLILPGANRE
jgi:hypothetical protein